MAILEITNRDTAEKVWMDARFSDGGVPFDELEPVSGFPRWVASHETFQIEMFDRKELLYRRNLDSNLVLDENRLSDLYRIAMTGRGSFDSGFIWPLPRFRIGYALPVPADSSEEPINRISPAEAKTIMLTDKVRTIRNYLIEPFFKVAGYIRLYQQAYLVSVKITNLSNATSGTRLIIEALVDEAMSLIDSFVIKKGNLEGKARPNMFVDTYRSRGFRVPISVPLKQFFDRLA